MINLTRAGYLNEDSKKYISKESIPIYEKGIAVAFQLFELTQSETFLESAFRLAEWNKARLLLESMQSTEALNASGVTQEVLAKESAFRTEITFYQRELRTAQEKNASEKVRLYESKLLSLREKYDLLIKEMEKTFPAYHKAKFLQNPVALHRLPYS